MDKLEAAFAISNVQDNGDEKSIRYGIIADTSTPGMDNPQSEVFFHAMFEHQHLGLCSDWDSGHILFDKDLVLQWIANIDNTMQQFFLISHNTTISGRRMEAESLKPTNNDIGQWNVIFNPEAGTGAYDANYHKGQVQISSHKHILWHMPYEVFHIIYILIHIIHPIELFFICRAFFPPGAQARVHDAYANHVFASFGSTWKSTTMTSALGAFFQDVAGFPMGLCTHQHFSVTLQQHYLDYGTAKSGSVLMPEQLALKCTLNHLRGHEKEVGDTNYAWEGNYGSSSVNKWQRSQLLSRLWHKASDFPTSHSEAMDQRVVTNIEIKNI